jgi:hypothetical protein
MQYAPRKTFCDILILGGGMAGAASAAAAAAGGASVILAEKSGRLGGTATNGLVSTLCGCYSSLPGRRRIIGGFRDLLAEELHRTGGIAEGVDRDTHRNDTCDPELLACALDTLMKRSGARVMLSTCVVGADFSGGLLRSVDALNTESGSRFSITPRLAVDASGGALLSRMADPSSVVSGDDGGKLQAATMVFRMDSVDGVRARLVTKEQIRELLSEARRNGDVTGERGNGVLTVLPGNSSAIVNANWVKADMSVPEDVTRGLIEGREKALENARFFRKYVPGFGNAVLSCIAPSLGVREASRIKGAYVLSQEDITEGRLFDDAVSLGSWPMEYHDYEQNRLVYLWSGKDYSIPYRCMLPEGLENVLAAGRNISVSSMAYASTRVMGPCMALGQAAGTAMRLCLKQNILPKALYAELLRKTITDEGAILE